ncbi:MAG: hypothetical protein AVDCRST_MAG01-01-257, partial [uncultured Rubrobacteraceae bacterium]
GGPVADERLPGNGGPHRRLGGRLILELRPRGRSAVRGEGLATTLL